MKYQVKDPQGQMHIIDGPEGASPEEVIAQAQKLVPAQQPQQPGFKDIVGKAIKNINPVPLAKNVFAPSPANLQRYGGPLLPIGGGAIGGPIGAASGEFLRQLTGTALAPETVPKTGLGRFGSVALSGASELPQVTSAIEKATGMFGKGMGRVGQALTGTRAGDIEQGAKQGLSTYGAKSMDAAQEGFRGALTKEGVPLQRPIEEIADPQMTVARRIVKQSAAKLDQQGTLSAAEALKAKQQTGRLIKGASNIKDKETIAELTKLKNRFDSVLTSKSPAIKDASNAYRQAIVKKNLLQPFRVNKSGEFSAVAPMVGALAAAGGSAVGGHGGGEKAGLGYLAMSSPAVLGLGATMGGSLGSALANPAIRQSILQAILARQRNNENPNP